MNARAGSSAVRPLSVSTVESNDEGERYMGSTGRLVRRSIPSASMSESPHDEGERCGSTGGFDRLSTPVVVDGGVKRRGVER